MAGPLKVVYFVNQFFGGVGAEEKANIPVEVKKGPIGPARLFQQLLGDGGTVEATIICGDNYFNEQREQALSDVTKAWQEAKPDLVVAGPAFDAGRYGLACGAVCAAAEELGIPAITAMHPENPGVLTYRRQVFIVPTGASPVDLPDVVSQMFQIALKLTSGEEMGPAETEGYLGRGIRKVSERSEPGYKRAVDMLASKLRGEPYHTEVPFEAPEAVPAASLQRDLSQATIALISTGGLIPIGNPDRQVSGNADRYFSYPVDELESLTGDDWEAFHGGYYNQIASDNPNYILPLSHLRHLESQGVIGRVASQIITLPGVSTPVAKSKHLGAEMAQELKDAGVDACILVAT